MEEKALPELLIRSKYGSASGYLGKGDVVESYVSSTFPELSRMLQAARETSSYTSLILLETILGEALLLGIRRALRGNPFTIGIVLAYFFLVRAETRKILTIIHAKIMDIDSDRLAGLL
jgi:vacuolar-type H+-ATPase subunit C/Vma6